MSEHSEQTEQLKQNLLNPEKWIRIVFMALFGVVCWVLGIVLAVLIVIQALFSLVTGKDNSNLRDFGKSLSIYFQQILMFLTYNSEQKPFPFADWPESNQQEGASAFSGETSEEDVFSDISFTPAAKDEEEDQQESAPKNEDERP